MSEVLPEVTAGVACGACGHFAGLYAGSVSFYLKNGEIKARVWMCEHCGTYIQDADFDSVEIRGHFEVASYTDPGELDRWRRLRSDFFAHILNLSSEHMGHSLKNRRCLDFGIAYGIMLDMLKERGAIPAGVETVPFLRDSARARGHDIYEDVYTLPTDTFDLVTAVDSFYYIQDPVRGLNSLRRSMKCNGVLVMRLANRTPYFNLVRSFGLRITEKRFGDLKYFYTKKGVELLLRRTGFRIEQVYWSDRGRKDPRFWESIFYKVSRVANGPLSVRLSPGMTVVARPLT